MVTERLETVPPFSENPTERAKSQSRWRSHALNRYAYRSRPVAIQIGPDGKIRRPAIDRLPLQEDTPVRVTTTLKNGKLEFEAILICDEDRWCKDPGLHGNSRVEINATPRHFESRTGKGFPYRPDEYQQIPKDVILGIRDQYDRLIEPGTYEISVTFPANLWLDDVRNPGPLTGKTKITVEQKDLLDLPDKAP